MIWLTRVIIFLSGLTTVTGEGASFKQSVCKEFQNISCLEVPTDTGTTEQSSQWAPGPYLLPMSIYGCPESHSHGWKEGYISLTFSETIEIFTSRGNLSLENDLVAVDSQWPYSLSFLLGPASGKTFKLNFCYKYRQSKTHDTGRWLNSNYSIYSADSGCPKGFSQTKESIRLPQLERWTTNGYIPKLNISEHGDYAILALTICTHEQKGIDYDAKGALNIAEHPFILLQNSDSNCPVLNNGVYLEKEMLVFGRYPNMSSAVQPDSFQNYCILFPDSWITADADEMFDTFGEGAFIWSTNTFLSEWNYTQNAYLQDNLFGVDTFGAVYQEFSISWIVLDIGRTFSVSGIYVRLEPPRPRLARRSLDKTFEPTNTSYPQCMISRGQWDFLYFSALSCPAVPYFLEDPDFIVLMFLREMNGRYIALTGRPEDLFIKTITYVDVFTNRFSYYGGDSCNIDLGMKDGSIQDSQISASSIREGFLAEYSRPYEPRGWCADVNDKTPYITIDLLAVTKIDSITLWSWMEGNGLIFGALAFSISYAEKTNVSYIVYETKFYSDLSRPINEEQSFWFSKPFMARYVKIHVSEPFTEGLNCLRFELHGCRATEDYHIVPPIYKLHPIYTTIAFVQTIGTAQVISSLGFPDIYQGGQDYKWVIRIKNKFIKLVFTTISLAKYKADTPDTCNDSIVLSDQLLFRKEYAQVIDNRLNKEVFFIDTSHRQLVLSFMTCLHSSKKQQDGNGFEAVITTNSDPGCFTLSTSLLTKNRNELCTAPSMVFTSLSFLGLSFIGTKEKWTIHIPRRRIQLVFKEFFVACKSNRNIGPELKVIESTYERAYCSLSRPPDTIESKSDMVNVTFTRNEIRFNEPLDGFRLMYYVMNSSYEHLIDYQTRRTEVADVALGKPAFLKSSTVVSHRLFPPDNATARQRIDGVIGCYDIAAYTGHESPGFWWTVDLQDIYNLHYIVLFYEIPEDSIIVRNTDISTGLDISNIPLTSFQCNLLKRWETIYQHNTHARYVRIKHSYKDMNPDPTFPNPLYKEHKAHFGFCEVKIYGVLDRSVNEQRRQDLIKQTEEKLSRLEYDSYNSYRVYHCPLQESVDREYNQWSKWSDCSNRCGIGSRKRTRVCKRTSCKGEDTEYEKCEGNISCPVWQCAKSFRKCYSIFFLLSNWKLARQECLRRNLTLVSIYNLDELRFIKYLFREKRYMDIPLPHQLKSLQYGARYYTHIGLYQMDTKNLVKSYKWLNGTQPIFTAWNSGEPSTGDCVRMNYQYFEPDNTWESEDCSQTLADSFVCETTVMNNKLLSDAEVLRLKHVDYTKRVSETFTGKTCQAWMQQTPHQHITVDSDFPGETLSSVSNYCRDLLYENYLWCYTTDVKTRNEPCIADAKPDTRCLNAIYEYSGKQNTTVGSKKCKRWYEYEQNFKQRNWQLPESSLQRAENYCRDPFKDGFIWCYTERNEWEPCLSSKDGKLESNTFTTNETTAIETFQCGSGHLIPLANKCDHKFDCQDLTDETDCWGKYKIHELVKTHRSDFQLPDNLEESAYFLCNSGELVSVIARCDQIKDCLDSSDEINCTQRNEITDKSICAPDEFRCTDGDCIHISQICDFVVDCLDGSDEYCNFETCSRTKFQCGSGQCIETEKRCDGFIHCVDRSDEENCEVCNNGDLFHCDSSRCIPKRLLCDGYTDCEDKSDETSCAAPSFISCSQWWGAGYRKSGTYEINGVEVICSFDLLAKDGIVRTIFKNRDMMKDQLRFYFGNERGIHEPDYIELADYTVTEHINKGTCQLKISQICLPAHAAILDFDVSFYQRALNICTCEMHLLATFGGCARDSCINPYMTVETCDPQYTSSSWTELPFNRISDWQTASIDILPLECETAYTPPEDVLTCEGDVKVIDTKLKCVYDVDAYGYLLGCRSKSHLENCGSFECPASTIKCPGSYCIALKFVCDGEYQCPGGEDEKNCGCRSGGHEVIILADYNFLTNGDLSVDEFAGQLSNPDSVARILSYEADQPLETYGIGHTRLNIEDKVLQLQSFDESKDICKYKVMANQFLDQVKFTDKKINRKSVIFLETDSNAAELANELFSNNSITFDSNILIYRVLEDANVHIRRSDKYQHVRDVYIPRWKALVNIGADFFQELCGVPTKVYCPDEYKCASSKKCIPLENLCDGINQCTHGDDERLCDFKCPYNCTCVGYMVICRNKGFEMVMVEWLPTHTRQLDLSMNNALNRILEKSYIDLKTLVRLNLSHCNIQNITANAFNRINNIKQLDLRFNLIRKITSGTFSGLNLDYIYLSGNTFIAIDDYAFSGLSVEVIDFESSSVSEFNQNIFTGVRNVKQLRTPAFKFCCIRPNYLTEENCYPYKDPFSSCEDLMRFSVLQTMLWLVGLSAFFGNILSFIYRLKYDRSRLKLGFGIFVTNLAVADFVMGVYLIIIAVADAAFRKRYIFNDDYWRNSAWCNLAGVLSSLSSEASVLFLCLITLDRLLVIKFPFGQIRFDAKKANISACVVWILSLATALVPLLYESYFQNRFYTKSGVCIALPFTRDRPPGWLYSVTIFIGFNFATFLLIAFGQWSIFTEVRKSSARTKQLQSARKKDLVVARNLLLVVTTDFLCWFPIGVMGMMALNGQVISGDVYAWTAVFILPINSALNPVLYTLTAILGKTKFNPSTEEQSRTELTKEIGRYFNDFWIVSRHLSVRISKSKYKSVSFVLHNGHTLSLNALLKISAKLIKLLDVIHRGSLVMGNLSKHTVYVRMSDRQITGGIKISGKPHASRKSAEMSSDMLQAGVIVNCLLKKFVGEK